MDGHTYSQVDFNVHLKAKSQVSVQTYLTCLLTWIL